MREHAENGLLTRHGQVRIVEWRNRVLRDDDGRPRVLGLNDIAHLAGDPEVDPLDGITR